MADCHHAFSMCSCRLSCLPRCRGGPRRPGHADCHRGPDGLRGHRSMCSFCSMSGFRRPARNRCVRGHRRPCRICSSGSHSSIRSFHGACTFCRVSCHGSMCGFRRSSGFCRSGSFCCSGRFSRSCTFCRMGCHGGIGGFSSVRCHNCSGPHYCGRGLSCSCAFRRTSRFGCLSSFSSMCGPYGALNCPGHCGCTGPRAFRGLRGYCRTCSPCRSRCCGSACAGATALGSGYDIPVLSMCRKCVPAHSDFYVTRACAVTDGHLTFSGTGGRGYRHNHSYILT